MVEWPSILLARGRVDVIGGTAKTPPILEGAMSRFKHLIASRHRVRSGSDRKQAHAHGSRAGLRAPRQAARLTSAL